MRLGGAVTRQSALGVEVVSGLAELFSNDLCCSRCSQALDSLWREAGAIVTYKRREVVCHVARILFACIRYFTKAAAEVVKRALQRPLGS
jgi:hypothetical protein